MMAIAVVATFPCLLALIYIGSSTVFEDVVSMFTSGLYASDFISCPLLLWRRVTSEMVPHSSPLGQDEEIELARAIGVAIEDTEPEIVQPPLMWGPWRVPGLLGIVNNAFACVYILFVLFWSFWQPDTPATAENVNYSMLVTGVVLTFSIMYYYVWGKKQYVGPLVEHQVRSFARKGT